MTQCFPAPHTDSANSNIDLNEIFNIRKNYCFLFRAATDDMNETGIFEGDILVVDKSIPVRHANIVLVVMDGEFCIRSLFKRGGVCRLFFDGNQETELPEAQEVTILGVVTARLRQFV